MRRNFYTTRVQREGNTVSVKRAVCAQCGDNAEVASDFSATTAASKFRSTGWIIGNNPNHDRCPACARAAKKKSDQQPEQEPVMAPEKVVQINTAQSYPRAEPPRQPTRLEISRIIDALSDAYPVVDKGYLAGFSDESVASKLDMPRAWVTAERDRCFGAAKAKKSIDLQKYREAEWFLLIAVENAAALIAALREAWEWRAHFEKTQTALAEQRDAAIAQAENDAALAQVYGEKAERMERERDEARDEITRIEGDLPADAQYRFVAAQRDALRRDLTARNEAVARLREALEKASVQFVDCPHDEDGNPVGPKRFVRAAPTEGSDR